MHPILLLLALSAPSPAQEVAPPPAPAEEELPPLVKEPELVEFVEAPYPDAARAAGVEGTVHLALEIDEAGNVVDVEVLEPAGHGFDEAAVEAARRFRFLPAEDATGPVPVIIEFAYGFVLDAAAREGAHPQEGDPGIPEPQAVVNLEGQLLEMGTRRPLPRFPVLLPDLDLAVETDEEGRFSFSDVPPGTHTLRAVSPGFQVLERPVEVVTGEATEVRLWIRNLSYGDDELVGVYRREKEEVTRRTLTVEEIRRVPGTFGDPVRVVQTLPGAARSPFSTGLLIIRGANPEDSAVYVDGIRIPLIYHLDGILSVINGDLVESVDYLPGGYGVEYGRSLGGVIDVRTRRDWPEAGRVTWTTDILHSGAFAEGRTENGAWGWAAGARRSYIDVFLPLFTGDSGYVIQPRWYDYQLKTQRLDLDGGRFSVFLFGFRDQLDVATPDDVAQGTDADTQGDIGMVYGTHRLVVDWERRLGQGLDLRVTPSIGVDTGEGDLGGTFSGRETQWIAEVRAELPWEASDHLTITPGADLIGGTYDFEIGLPFDPSDLADYDPIGEREDWSLVDSGWALGPDFYLETDWHPLADPDRLRIMPGVRLDYTVLENGFRDLSADPRLSLLYRPGARSLLKASAGLYHQPPQPMEMYRPDGRVDLGYERAWSGTVGWEQQVGPAIHFDAEVFYKWMDDLVVVARELQSMDDPYFFNAGIGRVYGTEVLLRHDPVGRFFGWLSYTLSRSERNDWPEYGEDWYPFDFDQTHILVGVAGYRLPRDFELSGKLQYVTGNPTTPYAGGVYDIDQGYYWAYSTADRNSERLPDYFALDLRVEKLFTFRSWQLRAYVDLIHAIRGLNPEFVVYNYDYTESAYVRGLPFVPSPGFTAEFHF